MIITIIIVIIISSSIIIIITGLVYNSFPPNPKSRPLLFNFGQAIPPLQASMLLPVGWEG